LSACAIVISLSACSLLEPRPDLSRFFVLTSTTEPAGLADSRSAIGLGPIDFPAYLQRSQIVTRVSQNEIMLSEGYRWGEPLDTNFSRVLAENLSNLLGTDRIVMFPWFNNAELDFAVRITVLRFETSEDGTARLLARWRVVSPQSDEVVFSAESDLREQTADGSPDAAVAALSGTVAKLAREIADAIEKRGA
jgi:uncharacterized lipoprotein YmbA